ncbi:MAG: lysophospholipid acyltransferase family protein [Proteobacteria bacterium]|nr:lysophospholipid acyltransferase family protein [Pseudomonadota bacterium]
MLGQWRAARRLLALGVIIVSLLIAALIIPRILCSYPKQARRLAGRLMRLHLAAMARVSGLRIQLQGQWPADDRSFVLLSNHVSYWDIIALGSLHEMAFVAKKDIERWPLLGAVAAACNSIFVDRESTLGRWKALRVLQKASQEISYCVFPEGTTTAQLCPSLQLWRRGNLAVLRKPGVPVYIAGLHYRDQLRQAWIDDDSLLPHLWRTLQDSSIDIMIEVRELAWDGKMPLAKLAHLAWEQSSELCRMAEIAILSKESIKIKKAAAAS